MLDVALVISVAFRVIIASEPIGVLVILATISILTVGTIVSEASRPVGFVLGVFVLAS